MLPLLYYSTINNPNPASMRCIGTLTKCENCVVTEKLNSDYTLSASFLPTDELYNEIQNQRFILVKANPFDEPQFFEIHNSGFDEVGRLTVAGRHIKHSSYNNLLTTNYDQPTNDTPIGHWNSCCDSTKMSFKNYFSFSTDITSTGSMETGYSKSDMLGKFLEELATVFNGEYHYDNFNIELLKSRGAKKNYMLRWDKNIASPNLTLSADSIYSHVVAYADFTTKYKPTEDVEELEFPIQICSKTYPLNGNSKLNKVYMYNATNQFKETTIAPSKYYAKEVALNVLASKFASSAASNAVQTSERANLKLTYKPALEDMKEIGMGDTVNVVLKGGRLVEAKVTGTQFDCLSERWTSMEFGKERLKLADYIAKRR